MSDAYLPCFEMTMPIRWGDMDAFGHVNNTVYFRYMEQTRISWFESLEIGTDGEGNGPVLVNASMEFLKQLHYPGDIVTRLKVGPLGRSSFDTAFELLRADEPDVIYARGNARCVWVNYALGKSVPLPDVLREQIARLGTEQAG
jgi:acyl-CoA thioester hydrolase